MYMDMHVATGRSLKRVLNALNLELQAVVSHPLWMPGSELGFSARLGNSSNIRVISPVPAASTFEHVKHPL